MSIVFNPFTGNLDFTSVGGTGIQSIVAGDNISVDDTDPNNPIVSASGGSLLLGALYDPAATTGLLFGSQYVP
jgi:hypothetical protein